MGCIESAAVAGRVWRMTKNDTHSSCVVVTIGPWHDRPWWWKQLVDFAGRDKIQYERISIGNRTAAQLGIRQMPALLRRVCTLLRRARTRKASYVFTFEADITCYLIGLLQYAPLFAGPRHVILQFISREKEQTLSSKLKDLVARTCLRTAHRVVVSSRRER